MKIVKHEEIGCPDQIAGLLGRISRQFSMAKGLADNSPYPNPTLAADHYDSVLAEIGDLVKLVEKERDKNQQRFPKEQG